MWLQELAVVDVYHDDTCCNDTTLIKQALKTHPVEEPATSDKPKSDKGKGGQTKRKRLSDARY